MKTLKNMEIIFTVALAVACSAIYIGYTQPQTADLAKQERAPARASVIGTAGAGDKPVVIVSAKRMTSQEKAQSLREERSPALLASNGSKM